MLCVFVCGPLSEVFVVMDEIWQLSLLVDSFASGVDGVGKGSGTATEHSDFAHLSILNTLTSYS